MDFSTKEAIVYVKDEKVTIDDLIQAINEIGFRVSRRGSR